MNTAYVDFIASLNSLREEATQIPILNHKQLANNRSSAHLRLNGLNVVAFNVLEDFVRRRAYEVVRWIGEQDFAFGDLPKTLQSSVLIGTLKGLHFSLDRTEKNDRAFIVQLEGMLLGNTGENVKFIPSEYFFGRASSNISEGSVKVLLEAFGFSDVVNAIDHIGEYFRTSIRTNIFSNFGALALKRHSAAHTFPVDYRISDFIEDVTTRLPIFAACVDACLSQYAYIYVNEMSAAWSIKFDQSIFLDQKINIRVVEWNSGDKRWEEYLNGRLAKKYTRADLEKRKLQIQNGSLAPGHSVLWMNEKGAISEWHSPIA